MKSVYYKIINRQLIDIRKKVRTEKSLCVSVSVARKVKITSPGWPGLGTFLRSYLFNKFLFGKA